MKPLISLLTVFITFISFTQAEVTRLEYIILRDNENELEVLLKEFEPIAQNDFNHIVNFTAKYHAPHCLIFLIQTKKCSNYTIPLFSALCNDLYANAQVLLEEGANVNGSVVKKEKSWTLLEYFGTTFSNMQFDWLLAHGANPDLKQGYDTTYLREVCGNLGHYNKFLTTYIIASICRHGANPNASDEKRKTCLHALTEQTLASTHMENQRFYNIIQIITAGGNPNSQDQNGTTSLHYAAVKNEVAIAAYLLNKGARKNIKNNHGQLPIDLVKDNPDLYAMLASNELPPMPAEAVRIERELAQLKQKLP